MIAGIRAIAIDDEETHLEAIHQAAIAAHITCHKIHYPKGLEENERIDFDPHLVRLVICDLHLEAPGAMSSKGQIFGSLASAIEQLGLVPWTPYIMVLWSRDASDTEKIDELKKFLEERINREYLPSALVTLDKNEYGIPGAITSETAERLWKDLRERVERSPGLNLLLQWENELLRASSKVVSDLMRIVRTSSTSGTIPIDDAVDLLLTRIARTATSASFAQEQTRAAAVEGLSSFVSDEMLHLPISDAQRQVWLQGMTNTDKLAKSALPELTLVQAAALNDIFHVSRDGSATAKADRGAVFECGDDISAVFDIDNSTRTSIFGIKGKWPKDAELRYVQLEGACDAAQRKRGVVPLVLAVEVNGQQEMLDLGSGKGTRPASVEVTPVFLANDMPRKLLLNVRYFISRNREDLNDKRPLYRLRDALVSQLAFAWATHTIRPGIVEFHAGTENSVEQGESHPESTEEAEPLGARVKNWVMSRLGYN